MALHLPKLQPRGQLIRLYNTRTNLTHLAKVGKHYRHMAIRENANFAQPAPNSIGA